MGMTTTTILPNGDRGYVATPQHKLMRRIADLPAFESLPTGEGASVTQMRALERKGLATLARSGAMVLGVLRLTFKGAQHLAMLDAEAERLALVERRAAGDLS